ncbi:protein lyl-1 isoform X3 [Ranitomeya imitator]|uniref:protein lyl-1 isoform X3 n=1 Tax=Ranitomeya imitator TaxID=111125 RepID=UPI0037E94FE7
MCAVTRVFYVLMCPSDDKGTPSDGTYATMEDDKSSMDRQPNTVDAPPAGSPTSPSEPLTDEKRPPVGRDELPAHVPVISLGHSRVALRPELTTLRPVPSLMLALPGIRGPLFPHQFHPHPYLPSCVRRSTSELGDITVWESLPYLRASNLIPIFAGRYKRRSHSDILEAPFIGEDTKESKQTGQNVIAADSFCEFDNHKKSPVGSSLTAGNVGDSRM